MGCSVRAVDLVRFASSPILQITVLIDTIQLFAIPSRFHNLPLLMIYQVVLRTVILAFGGLLMYCSDAAAQESANTQEPLNSVSSGPIEIADAQVSLIQNTFVAAPIAGVVAEVTVAEGDQVDVGHRLVLLDSQQATTELEAARAAYEAARLQSDNDVDARYARRTLQVRQRELQQSIDANRRFAGSISETEIIKLQLVVDQSELAIEQAEHNLQIAHAHALEKLAASQIVEARLRKHGVDATVSGQVVEVAVEPGEWVEPGKPIVRIISLNPIRVECFVDGREHGPELVGRGIEFIPSGSRPENAKLKGKVTFVSPELNPVTGQVRLWATIGNPELEARAGMQGRLVIDAK
jgi:multidrug efflux pump subunit AcrA (membrane-fusion protein)